MCCVVFKRNDVYTFFIFQKYTNSMRHLAQNMIYKKLYVYI